MITLLTIGLTGMQIVLERGQEHNWFQSSLITTGATITVLALVIFVVWALRVREPIVNLRVLRNIPLSVGAGMGMLFGIAFFGTTFSLTQFPQRPCTTPPIPLAWCCCRGPSYFFSPCPSSGGSITTWTHGC